MASSLPVPRSCVPPRKPKPDRRLVAGVDEAGRGCLVGPVIAAAVILDPERPIAGLTDSKSLRPEARRRLADRIRRDALAWSIGRAEPSEIDRRNILQASLLAMRRAVLGLGIVPAKVRVDGNRLPDVPMAVEAVVGGDGTVAEISAASILAKVARDREMQLLDKLAPGYGIESHKGYPTPSHKRALQRLGASPWHRRSFRPVREV